MEKNDGMIFDEENPPVNADLISLLDSSSSPKKDRSSSGPKIIMMIRKMRKGSMKKRKIQRRSMTRKMQTRVIKRKKQTRKMTMMMVRRKLTIISLMIISPHFMEKNMSDYESKL